MMDHVMYVTTAVTVIVPVYGDAGSLSAKLVQMADHFSIYGAYRFSYVIVDNVGSSAHPAVSAFARHRDNVKVLAQQRRRSLQSTLRDAFALASSEFALVLDSDLTYHPSVGMELIELLEREHADVAVASEHRSGAYRTTVLKGQHGEGTLMQKLLSKIRLAFSSRPPLCFACRLA